MKSEKDSKKSVEAINADDLDPQDGLRLMRAFMRLSSQARKEILELVEGRANSSKSND